MRISKIEITDHRILGTVNMSNLGNIVIVAGENGAGKSRISKMIKQKFLPDRATDTSAVITINATREEEENFFGGEDVVINQNGNANFSRYLANAYRRGGYTGVLLSIGSDRVVAHVSLQRLTLSTPDPADSDVVELPNPSFQNEWQSFINFLYKREAARVSKIAKYVHKNKEKTCKSALEEMNDPLDRYQYIVKKMLPEYTIKPLDVSQPSNNLVFVNQGGEEIHFSNLSSGEKEVLKILFFLEWKNISHSTVMIDEPELHLHSALVYRLVETLKAMGGNTNQYIFFTHSTELLSTHYSNGSSFFIEKGVEGSVHNLAELEENHSNLTSLVTNHLGYFAISKNIIFVEGEVSSIDRHTYSKILEKYFDTAVVVPLGSVLGIHSLNRITSEINNTVFGINFFMIRDRDGLSESIVNKIEESGKIRCIGKRHIENYYLDGEILANVCKHLYLDTKFHHKEKLDSLMFEIAEKNILKTIAQELKEYISEKTIYKVPKIKKLTSDTEYDDLKKVFIKSVQDNIQDLAGKLDPTNLEKKFDQISDELNQSLVNGTRKSRFPGKMILNEFCAKIGVKSNRLREAYVDLALETKPEVFGDIIDIINDFKESSSSTH